MYNNVLCNLAVINSVICTFITLVNNGYLITLDWILYSSSSQLVKSVKILVNCLFNKLRHAKPN